jgi:hypothetical protein
LRPTTSVRRPAPSNTNSELERLNRALSQVNRTARPRPAKLDEALAKRRAGREAAEGLMAGFERDDNSLLGQLQNEVKAAVTQGPSQILKAGVQTTLGPIRAAVDLVKDGELRGDGGIYGAYKEYAPLSQMVSDSLENSYRRNIDPITPWNWEGPSGVVENWKEASDENRTISAIFEDVGNAAIVAGAASRVVGRAPRPMRVANIAEKAAIEGAPAPVRSLSSGGYATTATDIATAQRQAARSARTVTGELADVATVPTYPAGRGLAGAARRAGYEDLAVRLNTVGENLGKATRLFDAPDNLTVGWQFLGAGKALGAATRGAGRVATRLAPYANRILGEDNLINQRVDPDARARRDMAEADVEWVRTQKMAVTQTAAKVLGEAEAGKLSKAEGAVVLNALDHRFDTLADGVRTLIDEGRPDEARALVDQYGADKHPTMRPTFDDVVAIIDYADNPNTPRAKVIYEIARKVERELIPERTQRALDDQGLNPEQLGNEMLTPKVDEIRRGIEADRNRAQRERAGLDSRTVRASAVERAQVAINTTLPDPPDVRTWTTVGARAGAAAQALRELHNEHGRTVKALNDAIKEYIKADQGRGQNSLTAALAQRIDELTEEAVQLEQQILTDQRRFEAAQALSKATGDVETVDANGNVVDPEAGIQAEIDDIVTSPEPDLSNVPTVKAIETTAREVVDHIRAEMVGEIDQMTGGERPRIPGPDDVGKAEYDWYDSLSVEDKRILARDGWLSSEGATPDDFARVVNAELGTDLSIDGAVSQYLELVDQVRDLRSRGNQTRTRREKLSGLEIDADGKLANRYARARQSTSRPVPDSVVQMAAERLGMSPEVVSAALNGNAKRLREAFADDVTRGYEQVKAAWDSIEPEMKASIYDTARQIAEEGGDLFEYIMDVAENYGLDARDTMSMYGATDPAALWHWLEGADPVVPDTFVRAVTEAAGPAQKRLVARLQQAISKSKSALRETYSRQRDTRRLLDRSRELDADRLDDAAGRVDIAEIQMDAAAARIDDVETNRPRLDETTAVTPKVADVWKRYRRSVDLGADERARTPGTPEKGTVVHMSRAEKARVREGRVIQIRKAVQRDRQVRTRRARRFDDEIANLNTELGRSAQARLIEDINAPAVKSLFGIVRREGKPIGSVVPPFDGKPPSLTGVMESIVRKAAGSDGVDAVAAQMYAHGRFDSVAEMHQAFLDAAEDAGVIIAEGTDAFRDLRDSMMAEYALETMRQVQAAAGSTNMNLPYRVMAEARKATKGFPQEARNALEARFERYERSRNRHLRNMNADYLSVMPARFRQVARENLRAIDDFLDRAEKAINDGDLYLASIYHRLAAEAPTTLQGMIDNGIDPKHLVGGKTVSEATTARDTAGSGTIGRSAIRGTKQSKTGGRAVGLSDYIKIEAHEQIAQIDKAGLEAVRNHPGLTSRADSIIRDVIDEYEASNPPNRDGTPARMPPEMIIKALDERGWALIPSEKPQVVHRGTPVVPKLAVKAFDAQAMGTRPLPVKMLSAANRMFKYSVLAASPLWQIGNLVGNLFMATMGLGKVSILDVPRLMRQMKNDAGGWKALWDRGGLAPWAPDRLASHGLSYGEHQLMRDGWDPTKQENVAKRAVNAMYTLNEFMDNAFRSITYADQMQKMAADPTSPDRLAAQNMTASEAAVKHTLRALGDFTNMTAFEKRYLREVFPFWAWLRHQTLMTMRMPLYSPARTAYLIALTDLLEDEDVADEWYSMMGSMIPLGNGSALNLGGISPFAAPWEVPLNPFNIGTTVAATTPMLKLPVQLMTGYDPNRLAPTSRPYDERSTDLFGREESSSPITRLLSDPKDALGEIGYIAAGTLPQTKAARNVINGAGEARYGSGKQVGDGQYDDPNQTAILEILGGLRVPRPVPMEKRLDDLTQRILEGRP